MEMFLANATAYIRIPFQMDDPTSFNQLSLQMKYEDGVVAYLNGVEVLRDNLNGDSPAWNSRAQSGRLGVDAVQFRPFDLTDFLDVLRPGNNVLAIQGLNSSTTSRDFLMVPRLIAGDLTDDGRSPGAFSYVDPIELTQDTIVKARVSRDGQWSALTEAAFVVG